MNVVSHKLLFGLNISSHFARYWCWCLKLEYELLLLNSFLYTLLFCCCLYIIYVIILSTSVLGLSSRIDSGAYVAPLCFFSIVRQHNFYDFLVNIKCIFTWISVIFLLKFLSLVQFCVYRVYISWFWIFINIYIVRIANYACSLGVLCGALKHTHVCTLCLTKSC